MNSDITKKFVENLQAVRDAYEDAHGPDPVMDALVLEYLNKYLNKLNLLGPDVSTRRWAIKQIKKETMSDRLKRAESLVPPQTLENEDDFYDPLPSRDRPANTDLSGLYQWNPNPEIRGPHKFPVMNPFTNRPSNLPEFVPQAAAAAAPKRGGKTRKHNKKGKKSIRRRRH